MAGLGAVSNIGDLTGDSPVAVGLAASFATTLNMGRHVTNDIMSAAGDAATYLASPHSTTGPPDMDAIIKSTASQYLSAFVSQGITNLESIYGGQSFGLAKLKLLIFDAMASGKDAQVNQAIVDNWGSIRNGGFMMTGIVQERRTQSGVDMIVVGATPFKNAPVSMTTITDARGSYELVIPLDREGHLTSSLTIGTWDPLTGSPYGTKVVDLRGVDTSKPVSVPPLNLTSTIQQPTAPAGTPGSALAQLTCIGKTGFQVGPGGYQFDCNDPRNKTSAFDFRFP